METHNYNLFDKFWLDSQNETIPTGLYRLTSMGVLFLTLGRVPTLESRLFGIAR